MAVQRIVEDSPQIDLQAEAQHATGEVENPVSFNFCLLTVVYGISFVCVIMVLKND